MRFWSLQWRVVSWNFPCWPNQVNCLCRHKYDGSNGKWISTHQLDVSDTCYKPLNQHWLKNSGNDCIDIEQWLCVVDNVANGFNIYKIDSSNFVWMLITRDPIKTYPKGVAFANCCQACRGKWPWPHLHFQMQIWVNNHHSQACKRGWHTDYCSMSCLSFDDRIKLNVWLS